MSTWPLSFDLLNCPFWQIFVVGAGFTAGADLSCLYTGSNGQTTESDARRRSIVDLVCEVPALSPGKKTLQVSEYKSSFQKLPSNCLDWDFFVKIYRQNYAILFECSQAALYNCPLGSCVPPTYKLSLFKRIMNRSTFFPVQLIFILSIATMSLEDLLCLMLGSFQEKQQSFTFHKHIRRKKMWNLLDHIKE